MSDAAPPWQVQGLSVAYRRDPVLREVDLLVPPGVVMGIVGPNGAGKSTLLKAALGLVAPLAGRVEFFGHPLARVRHRVGYMPQSASLDWDFPATVFDVALMGTYGSLGWLRRPGRRERLRAAEALEQCGIADLTDEVVGELSGGQRQRVLLARALAQQPDLFLADEPFQGVDAPSQTAIVEVLHSLRDEGRTVVLVHHDLVTLPQYCSHVTLLNRRVLASGPVADVFTPEAVRSTYDPPGTA